MGVIKMQKSNDFEPEMSYSEARSKLKEDLHKQVCPYCGGHDVGVDTWGMFKGLRDWFYFCRDCGMDWKHEDTPEDFKLWYQD